jgi:hypothetical protein
MIRWARSRTGVIHVFPGRWSLGDIVLAVEREGLTATSGWIGLSVEQLEEAVRLAADHPDALEAEARLDERIDEGTAVTPPPARGTG